MAFSQNGQGYLFWDLNFYLIFGFRAIILASDMLEKQSRALKTWIIAQYPKKLEPKNWLVGLVPRAR